jgi:Holliday junction resolvasome RuvABC ATP-dependent DNA helicase subunit
VEARAEAAFVGRTAELGKLRHALEAAQAGSGAAVLVAGEAGIGKTRLALRGALWPLTWIGVLTSARSLRRCHRYW